jgi:hypothetical protein
MSRLMITTRIHFLGETLIPLRSTTASLPFTEIDLQIGVGTIQPSATGHNGFLTFYGDRFTDWGGNDPTFGYRTNLYEGEAILISIKFNHPTDLVGDVINGEWQTEDHRGFGFDEQLRPEMFNGTEAGFPHDNFDERIEWRVDTWYHALIVIGENEEFSLRIWEIDNPSSYNYYRSIHDGTWGLPDWGNREWTFNFTVNFGEVVLDAFTHITHDGFIW